MNQTNYPWCRALLCSLLLVFFSFNGFAQNKTELVSAEQHTLQSKILDEERVISVHLPADYQTSANKYPVLYLLDGRGHFQHAIAAEQYLSMRALIPNLIIVSIHNIDRNRDFSPVHIERIPTSGGAEKFLSFLSEELSVYIKKQFRASNFSVIMGHSFGGTFITYALKQKPELFDAFISVSPYLMFADDYMVEEYQTGFNLNKATKKYFYMTVGDEPNYFEPLKTFSSIMEKQPEDKLAYKYVKMLDDNHGTTPYLSLFNGLKFVFSDWNVPRELLTKELEDIDAHFKVLSGKYGIEVHTPENVINILGYQKLQATEVENAIAVFKENVKRYPKSANVYDSLGEAYEKNEQFKLALKNYEQACKIGAANPNPNLPVYLENRDRLKNKQ